VGSASVLITVDTSDAQALVERAASEGRTDLDAVAREALALCKVTTISLPLRKREALSGTRGPQ
jgi:hypothetical protein